MPSIRSSNRARTDSQRGFALISALVLAVLYFALMELMMIDATRALQEAQRFKAKVIASTLAESAAELAAERLVTSAGTIATAESPLGSMHGEMKKTGATTKKIGATNFELRGEATTSGVSPVSATCLVEGHIDGTIIHIDWARLSQ
ncbi:MAG: hypothetical protein ABI837_11605 [Acidobacteriota bacterium]